MISFLSQLVSNFVCWVETGVVTVVNLIIAGIGDAVAAVIALLPNMPAQPTLPPFFTDAVGYAYYICDFGWLIAYVATFFSLLGTVILVMVALRWLKVIE